MSQSLYTAMSGISAATTNLEVISNNISNVNTPGYKSSSVNFSDVYYDTLSSGSVASSNSGGTNPKQIGVGTTVSSITKNFNAGSSSSTGVNTDLMISGNGFFTVQGPNDTTYYTRAGDFTFDDSGNLVTSDGYKVLGTDSILSTKTSKTNVQYPTSLVAVVEGNQNMDSIPVKNYNAVDSTITQGTFSIQITTTSVSGGTTTSTTISTTLSVSSTIASSGTTADLIADLQAQLTAAGISTSQVSIGTSGGKITLTTGTGVSLGFKSSPTDTSNFVKDTGLSSTTTTTSTTGATVYTSSILDKTASLSHLENIQEPIKKSTVSIKSDGSLEVTYSDGSVLSAELDNTTGTYHFVYTTADHISVSGSELTVSPDVAKPANFVIQLATVTNTDGLIQMGSNFYKAGANSGETTFTVGSQMSAGSIKSGYLESSNVDLSAELSKMILAQRAVESNSRVFSTTSDVMSTIVQMGR